MNLEKRIFICEACDGTVLGFGESRDDALADAVEKTNSENGSDLYLMYSPTIIQYGPIAEERQGGVW